MRYEGRVFRPPSEAYSLIVQVTIGCSHNKCTFCDMYKEKRFRVRKLEEVKADFDEARRMYRRVGRIFLADGVALMCRPEHMAEILRYIKKVFPECERVTSYGSPASILCKKQEDLNMLPEKKIFEKYYSLNPDDIEEYNNLWLEYRNEHIDEFENVDDNRTIVEGGLCRRFLAEKTLPYTVNEVNQKQRLFQLK